MMQLQRRSLDNLLQIRNAAVNQEHAMAEQQQHREREHVGVYREEPKVGGFAGGDTKKRRGVSISLKTPILSVPSHANNHLESCPPRPLSQLQPRRDPRMAERS